MITSPACDQAVVNYSTFIYMHEHIFFRSSLLILALKLGNFSYIACKRRPRFYKRYRHLSGIILYLCQDEEISPYMPCSILAFPHGKIILLSINAMLLAIPG